MEIWRAKKTTEVYVKKGYNTYHIIKHLGNNNIDGWFTLEAGKGYAIYNCSAYSDGFYALIINTYSGSMAPIIVSIDYWNIDDYFVFDSELSEKVNTKKVL